MQGSYITQISNPGLQTLRNQLHPGIQTRDPSYYAADQQVPALFEAHSTVEMIPLQSSSWVM